jgi:hypothetical protein
MPPSGFPPAQGYYQPVVPAETSGLATVSLVAGIASVTPLAIMVFPPIVGAVTGMLAMVRIRKSQGHLKGMTMALWGTILSGFSLLVLAIVGIAMLASGADSTDTAEPAPAVDGAPAPEEEAEEPAPEPEPAPAGETVAMGETGTTGDWEVTVTGIETRSSYTDEFDLTEYPQGEFQVVAMEVTNQGTEATMFDASEALTLYDTDGNAHSVDFNLLGDFAYTDINPGNSLSGEAVVDVPEGTEVSELEIVDPFTFDDPLTVTVN